MKPARIAFLLTALCAAATYAAPTITCPEPAKVPCNSTNEITVAVSDPAGSDLGVVWSVNGLPMQTNMVPGADALVGTNVSFTAIFPFGTNVIVVTATDSNTNTAACSTTVTVIDTNPPVITLVRAAPAVIWPPNHKMKTISVHADVTDDCSSTSWKIIGVSSNEPELGKGSGHTSPDWQMLGDHALKVRAERSGQGSGRVYTITIQAVDGAGNLSELATTTVTVPHDQGHGNSSKPPKPPHGKGK
jgi:hypothetical protein